MTTAKQKTIVYIDGFNLYYGLLKNSLHKWLNLRSLFTAIRNQDNIIAVKYFTALVIGPGQRRQVILNRALEHFGVQVILGHHKKKQLKCNVDDAKCSLPRPRRYWTFEEKHTDVNIAVHLTRDAYTSACERMVLVTGDSDLVPAVEAVNALGIPVSLLVPLRDGILGKNAMDLRRFVETSHAIPPILLGDHHLPRVISTPGCMLTKPVEWDAPPLTLCPPV